MVINSDLKEQTKTTENLFFVLLREVNLRISWRDQAKGLKNKKEGMVNEKVDIRPIDLFQQK